MSGSNKILTVSYGTFSCTLEGFDEPFDTMRGIAEYFRDLAADDRYFGAEPPTPDADMLQAIAQREVRQRVEARTSDNGIALTKTAAPAPASQSAPQPPSAHATTEESGPLAYEDEYLMSDEPEDIPTVDKSIPLAEETDRVETVAEKLRRIRAVVSRTVEAGDAPNSFSAAPDTDGDTGAAALRDRAYTRTINEITADLSDEDEFEEDGDVDATGELDDSTVDEEDLKDLSRIDGADGAEDEEVNNLMTHGAETSEENAENAFAEPESATESSDEDLIASVMQAGQTPAEDETQDSTAEDVANPSSQDRKKIGDAVEGVDRLLKETDNQFADGASIRRRRVISQMRAAVAATKAERVVSGAVSKGAQEAEQSSPYKNDLRQAISRAVSATPSQKTDESESDASASAAPETPKQTPRNATRLIADPKAAPLVLVSSQRVDGPEDTDTDKKPTGGSFREFAKEMGANELLDLMEAAAAYSSFVEGQPHFSRPEIMKRVARVDPALEISREAGLRSFGQLLRQGKIRKLDRGQFVIDEETRFNPGQRIAGE